jgi:colanic acid/amylovoran biosynthesis glycosyltransferase
MDNIAQSSRIKLVYVIGRYPELTTTFIEREIKVLRQLGAAVQPLSLRYPTTPGSISPEHQAVRKDTIHLVPKSWRDFNLLAFAAAHLYFLFRRPVVYWRTLLYLLTHEHPDFKARLMTILHFSLGVYAAFLLRRHDFDHLHAHFIDRAVVVALVVSRLLNKTYSLTAHANDIYITQILIREKIVNARFVVTVSLYNKAHLLRAYPGLDSDKIHILHPWVDPAQFTPPPARPPHERLHILSVGRLVEKKGQADLVEACYLLQQRGVDVECRIVGSGPLRSSLGDQIARRGLQAQVALMGGQPQSQVLELLRTWADVFVLPSVIARDGDREGIPVSLAEAMAMELPVISTDIVGIGELVQPGTGILVPPHNPPAVAEALVQIHTASLSARADMGHQGRAVVDAEFNLPQGVRQLADLFRAAVAHPDQ